MEIIKDDFTVSRDTLAEVAFKLAVSEAVEQTIIEESAASWIENAANAIQEALLAEQPVVQHGVAYHLVHMTKETNHG